MKRVTLKKSLITRLILIYFVIIFFFIIHSISLITKETDLKLERKVNTLTDVLYINLSTNVSSSTLLRLVNYISAGNDIFELYIVNQDNLIISSLRKNDINKMVNQVVSDELLSADNKFHYDSYKYLYKTNFTINNHQNLNRVTIYINMDIRNVNKDFYDRVIFSVVYLSIIVLLISVFIFLFVRKNILKPIIDVVNFCGAYGKGMLLDQIDYKFNNEIGDIYLTLNTMINDIEAQKKILVDAKEAANLASSAKSRFLSNMSHEIRTPLNSIIGFSDLLKTENLSKENHAVLDNIINSGHHLLNIINDILDFSKIEAGKLELEIIDIDLKFEVEKIVKIINFSKRNSNCEFIVNLEGIQRNYIKADPTRLAQIIINLVGNAAKFTEKGSVVLTVATSDVATDSAILEIRIKDTGIGIESSKIEKLFTPFDQLDKSNARKYGGTGLGLTITRKLVTMMDGEITITSELGKGCEFLILIPVHFASHNIILHEKNISEEDKESYDFNNYDVLVVEDNLVNQKLMTGIFKKMNVNFNIANNGIEALEKVNENKYHIIFMDVQMPQMDGFEATRKLRERSDGKSLYICGLSANAFKEDRDEALEAGMNLYITKPVTKQKIIEVFGEYALFKKKS